MIWFFQELIRSNVYSRIDYKFLIPGHTYGPADRQFAVIEKYAKRIENVYTPGNWYQHVREAFVASEHKIEVVEMQQPSFFDWYKALNLHYTERTKDKSNEPLNFHNAVWFNFGYGEKVVNDEIVEFSHRGDVWVRHTYDIGEEPQQVSYEKKKGSCAA